MNKYLIATAIGGIMEKPGFDYIDFEVIKAKSEDLAIDSYKDKHECVYWFPECMAMNVNNEITIINDETTARHIELLI